MAPLPNLIDSEIADLTQYFEDTENVAAAWRVFHLARKYDRPIPDSVGVEIDRFAAGVGKVAERAMLAGVGAHPVGFREKELYEVWRNGKDNPVGILQREWRDYWIFDAVFQLVEKGMKVGRAKATVAAMKGVGLGVDAVDLIWKRLNRAG